MKFYSITYDLRLPGRKYNELYDAIKDIAGLGNWIHPMESFWIVSLSDYSIYNADSIYKALRRYIDDNDSIMVCKMEISDRQGWMPKSLWDWLNEKNDLR